jgi:hypothetical protein
MVCADPPNATVRHLSRNWQSAYTPMVAVKKAADAKACATLASGAKGCTTAAAQ